MNMEQAPVDVIQIDTKNSKTIVVYTKLPPAISEPLPDIIIWQIQMDAVHLEMEAILKKRRMVLEVLKEEDETAVALAPEPEVDAAAGTANIFEISDGDSESTKSWSFVKCMQRLLCIFCFPCFLDNDEKEEDSFEESTM